MNVKNLNDFFIVFALVSISISCNDSTFGGGNSKKVNPPQNPDFDAGAKGEKKQR